MDTITIDLSRYNTVTEFHEELLASPLFPEYYGKNLDALHDVLASTPHLHMVIDGTYQISDEIRAFLPRLINVLNAASSENPSFTYEFTEDEEETE